MKINYNRINMCPRILEYVLFSFINSLETCKTDLKTKCKKTRAMLCSKGRVFLSKIRRCHGVMPWCHQFLASLSEVAAGASSSAVLGSSPEMPVQET